MKKYAIYPGLVESTSDGQWHFITAAQLMRLYGVNPQECVVVDERRPESRFIATNDLHRLYPCRHAEEYAAIRHFLHGAGH